MRRASADAKIGVGGGGEGHTFYGTLETYRDRVR